MEDTVTAPPPDSNPSSESTNSSSSSSSSSTPSSSPPSQSSSPPPPPTATATPPPVSSPSPPPPTTPASSSAKSPPPKSSPSPPPPHTSSSPPPPVSSSSIPSQGSSPPPPYGSSSTVSSPPPPPTSRKSPPSSNTSSSSSGSSSSSSSSSSDSTGLVVVVAVIGVLIIAMLIASCICCLVRKKKRKEYYMDPPPLGPKGDYYNGPTKWNSPSPKDHVMKLPPPPGGGSGWAVPPTPPPGATDTSSEFSSSHHTGLPPPSPNMGLGVNQSSFSYDELAAATGGFSQANLLGQGGFGYVHKGVLSNGKEVAVKSLKVGSGQGEREFQAEVEIISRVHHRHLVSLVGYCIAGGQRMLVYEFVPNNTLEHHLHGQGLPTMDWATRMRIALGSAKGLAYLHEDYVRQPSKNFRKSFYLGKDLKKLLDLPIEKRKAPLLLNFIPTYTSKLADTPRKRKKSASPSTASTEQVASTSEPADQPSTSAAKKRPRRLVKAAKMKQPQKKVLNLLADLPDDMDDEPALPTPQPKTKRVKKAQPKAKVTEVDDAEDAVPISKLAEKNTSAAPKRPAEAQPTGATQQKKQKSAAGTSSGSRGPKIPWEPKVTLEDRPVYRNESAADVLVGVALSTAVLLDGDMEKNEKMDGYENYARMLQHSVQAIQHAHSFSMLAFETGKRLEDTEKELTDLQKSQKKDRSRMKKLEDQAAEATKAKQIADEKAEAAEALRTVAVAQQKEAEEKAAQAQKELQEGLATKEADLNASYNKGMEDVAEDYKLQVKQACNHGFILGYNALAKKLNLPADSPWRKTESLRLPCPLPPSPSQAEVESESEADEDEALVRKPKSPTKIDLTGDEEVEAVPKKTDFGTLTSDLLLIGRSVEETVAEIDAEVAAEKQTEVTADKPAEASENKEAEVVVEGGGEVVPQPTPEAEVTPEAEAT